MDSHHATLGADFMVLLGPREYPWRTLGVRSFRLGGLLGVGPGGKCGDHAMVHGDRVFSLGHDPGKEEHAESVEHGRL